MAGKITVMGAGSWGTTFAKVLADAGTEVVLWARRRDVADGIAETRQNRDYLPGVALPAPLTSTSDPRLALDGADTVVLAVPSQTLRNNLTAWRALLPAGATLVSLAKGVELGTLKRMSEVVVDVTGVPDDQVAVVSGPNLAKEIAEEQPTATVIACRDHDRAVALQRACTTGYFRPYTITDVVGCELGGACKNVIALSCGMADGLGFGANTLATLMTRGLAETSRLGAALGADPLTFAGLAGLGDLVASCSSPLSRNRTFGARLGRGETMAQAQAAVGGQVAEGVKSCSSIRELALRHGVEMPITEVVHRVCHDGFDLSEMAGALIGRKTRPER
ncbi:NAD(P)H-dependent glycerol-3-phosphate dehydrogenase [Actinokineospora globicatena]|uniref:Glycerol-3-phosphate dehydrogenase [NAD(P)+] n=1 Tax=Actinokineospora globicatena TaxID=103729 RepID=A0A9W6VAS5_9PSEU|nr:NAD(P)H-dependent glycerol-3-phosphate dehydrogenase [Actinokineospora globicatena]MCP2305520.1 glycerol-3-phosphate dehydrogenase (NAD(P)+) [Actinokineospora globicatena]GLW81387.1 glycerol-3-phosphate dehydrogenase [NAD(P)+] [Actinokineospora globicatena]GLW87915.1 glycerol-3-phosphate dehydrogenase [NAD(P)+] [Actinokineospora globicatena]GLW94592.1 glycerol-3-phosphate dehydrogenase [NAD(P)+] [Actinokineospora globicatena]